MERYRFFDSIEGEDERYYTADEFAEFFEQLVSSGILNGGDNLQVVCGGTDMGIQIKEGCAWLGGYFYKIETEPLGLTLDAADPAQDRIDRIVIRLDKRLEHRYVKAFILKGEPAEEPIAPGLTRDENIFEIALAQVLIIAGKSFIDAYQITDERLNTEVCGLASSLITADTTDIFNQFQAWLNSKIAKPEGEFYTEWENWFEEIQTVTNLVTKTQFDTHQAASASLSTAAHIQYGILTAVADPEEWVGVAPFENEVEVEGILATDTPIVDIIMSGNFETDENRQTAWGYVYRITTATDSITLYATKKPEMELPIQIRVVR